MAESWDLSCHKDGLSAIYGVEFYGKTLASVKEKKPEILGTYCEGCCVRGNIAALLYDKGIKSG